MAEKIVIAELEINTKKAQDENAKLIQSIAKLQASQKDLKKETGGLVNANNDQLKSFAANDAQLKRLQSTYGANKKVLAENQTGIQGLNDALSKETKSINEARAQNQSLLTIRNQLKGANQAEKDAIQEINKKVDQNNNLIKGNVSELEKQKIGIGGYEKGIVSALGQVRIFGVSLGGVAQKGFDAQKALIAKRAAVQADTTATNAGTVAQTLSGKAIAATNGLLKLFKIALISTGIGAIVVLIGSLIAAFATTQAGADAMNKILIPVKATFEALFGSIQRFGTALKDVFSGNKSFFSALSGFFNDVKDSAKAGYKSGKELADLKVQIEKAENKQIVNKATILNQIKQEELISKDSLLTATERNKSGERAEVLSKSLLKSETDLLDLKIKELKIKQSLNDTSREEEAELQNLLAERITKQTEQSAIEMKFLGVKKALQAELEQQRKSAVDSAISDSKTLLDIYIQEQGIRAKTLSEDLDQAVIISDKKKSILKAEFAAKKITQSEFNLAVLELDNELLGQRAQLAADNATRELQIFLDGNQSKIDANLFLTDALLSQETDRLNLLAQKEKEFFLKKLDQGVINQHEYNDSINAIDAQNQINKDVLEQKRQDSIQQKNQEDFANKIDLQFLQGESEFEISRQLLDRAYLNELEAAKKSGAEITLIEDKFSAERRLITALEQEAKLAGAFSVLNGLSGLLGQETAAGKAVAIAQTTIATYQSATAAYKSLVGIPIVGPALAAAASGVAVASGLMNVNKIIGTNTQVPKIGGSKKLAKGGLMEIGGNRHSSGGTSFTGEDGTTFEAEKGELIGVMNRNASRLFMDFNNQNGGSPGVRTNHFATGGIVSRGFESGGSSPGSFAIDYDLLSMKIGQNVAEANRFLPAQRVAITDIREGIDNQINIEQSASF
jgi:hypothetical protein